MEYLDQVPGMGDLWDLDRYGQDSLIILSRTNVFGTFKTGLDRKTDQSVTPIQFDSVEFHGNFFNPEIFYGVTAITQDLKVLYTFSAPDTLCEYLGSFPFEHHFMTSWDINGNFLNSTIDSNCELSSAPCSRDFFKGSNGRYYNNAGYHTFDPSGGANYTHWNVLTSYNSNDQAIASYDIGGGFFSSGGWLSLAETSDNGFIMIGYGQGAPTDCGIYPPYSILKVDSLGQVSWSADTDPSSFIGPNKIWVSSIDHFGLGEYAVVGTNANDSISFLHFKEQFSSAINQTIKPPMIQGSRVVATKFKRISDQTGIIVSYEIGPAGNPRIGFIKVGKSGNVLHYDSYLHSGYCWDIISVNDTSVYFWGNNSQGPFIGIYSIPNLHISSISEYIQKEIRIHPNPAFEELQIVGNNASADYKIIDMMGRSLIRGELQGGMKESISILSLSMGTYILIIESEDGTSYRHRFNKL